MASSVPAALFLLVFVTFPSYQHGLRLQSCTTNTVHPLRLSGALPGLRRYVQRHRSRVVRRALPETSVSLPCQQKRPSALPHFICDASLATRAFRTERSSGESHLHAARPHTVPPMDSAVASTTADAEPELNEVRKRSLLQGARPRKGRKDRALLPGRQVLRQRQARLLVRCRARASDYWTFHHRTTPLRRPPTAEKAVRSACPSTSRRFDKWKLYTVIGFFTGLLSMVATGVISADAKLLTQLNLSKAAATGAFHLGISANTRYQARGLARAWAARQCSFRAHRFRGPTRCAEVYVVCDCVGVSLQIVNGIEVLLYKFLPQEAGRIGSTIVRMVRSLDCPV